MGRNRGALCGEGVSRHALADGDNRGLDNNGSLRDFPSWAASPQCADSSPGFPGGGADAGTSPPAPGRGASRREGNEVWEQMDYKAVLCRGSLRVAPWNVLPPEAEGTSGENTNSCLCLEIYAKKAWQPNRPLAPVSQRAIKWPHENLCKGSS